MCPVPWEMHPDCAGLWVQGQHGGSVCSPLCQIQLVPGAGMRMSILRCWCPYWDAGVHIGMQVLYQDMDSCSRVQLQNRVPGIWVPVLGYVYLYWDAALEMEYKFPFQDADPVLGRRNHTRM